MRNPTLDALLREIGELHDKKNKDYSEDTNPYSNFEYAAMVSAPFVGAIDKVFAVQIGNKLARLSQLLGRDKAPNNESVDDTLRDLVTYAAIWAAHYRDHHT